MKQNKDTNGREDATRTYAHKFPVLVCDNNFTDNRNIIFEYKGVWSSQIFRIKSLMALHYPLLFSYGEDGFRTDISHRGIFTYTPTKRDHV